ncbi:uncharacterized protein LOC124359534 [Homalodisca vitripennis]|uniref:uncharacterized protein LOC124359534 n=1 Tax=Homalodisca vitripennis TaxID=197043 RepID=UPI001EEAE4D6|nr:uncharacterized protein LOC124359534 [Homalodisca vitripennis]
MSSEEYEYYGLFPSTLFICHDDRNSMHFILSLRNIDEEKINELVKLMRYCGAKVNFDLSEATDFSALIVDHNDVLDFSGPAFTLNYIEECLNTARVQDISKYRQESTRHIAKGASCMNVVYFRRQGWSSLISGAGALKSSNLDKNIGRLESSSNEEAQRKDNRSEDELSDFVVSDDADVNKRTFSNHKEKESAMDQCSKITNKTSKVQDKKKHVINSALNGNIPSAQYTSDIQRTRTAAVSKTNNTQSDVCDSTSSSWSFVSDLESETENVKTTKHNKRSRQPYTYEERSNILKYIVHRHEYNRLKGREVWEIMERQKVCPSRTWQSMKEHFIKKIVLDLEPYTFLTNEQKRRIKSAFF